jgi:hypothetical protein
MGTINGRTRKDGTTAYVAQILLKRKRQIVHHESQTFDRKQVARTWIARRETELAEGITDRNKDVRLGEVIGRYVRESERAIGRTKARFWGRSRSSASRICAAARSRANTSSNSQDY